MGLLFGCVSSPPDNVQTTSDDVENTGLVWPKPPSNPRIRFLYEFHAPADIGYRASFSSRLRDVLVGSQKQNMERPYTVAVNSQILAIADPGISGVHLFNLQRRSYRLLTSVGRTDLSSPVSVALDEDRLFIADSALNRVFVLDQRHHLLHEIVDLERPTGLAYDARLDQLFVANTHAHRIAVFNRDGQFLRSFGERGKHDGQFNYPTHLTLANGRIFVNDTLNFRLQVLDANTGTHIMSIGEHGDGEGFFAQPKGVGVNSNGHIFVTEAVSARIQIFDMNGDFLLAFGHEGNQPGNFRLPSGLAIWDNRIYVADSGNRRVQVFEYLDDD
jgi:sugar lactone lactonase YvrE